MPVRTIAVVIPDPLNELNNLCQSVARATCFSGQQCKLHQNRQRFLMFRDLKNHCFHQIE